MRLALLFALVIAWPIALGAAVACPAEPQTAAMEGR